MLPNLLRYERVSSAELLLTPVTDDILLLPVSAPENHGPHLPLGTDELISEDVAGRVARDLAEAYPHRRIWLHPTWHLGGATIRGTGSVKAPSRLLGKVLKAYLRRFVRQGFRYFVVLSAHGGVPHTGALDDACAALRRMGSRERPVSAIAPSARVGAKAYFGGYAEAVRAAGVPLTDAEVADLAVDLHAGRMETAMILAIDPALVDPGYRSLPPILPPRRVWLEALARGIEKLAGRFIADEAKRIEFSQVLGVAKADLSWILRGRLEGYVGHPHRASTAEGEALLAAIAGDLSHQIRETFEGRLDPLDLRSGAYLFRRLIFTAGLVFAALLAGLALLVF